MSLFDGFTGTTAWDIGAGTGDAYDQLTSRFDMTFAFEPDENCWDDLQDLYGYEYRWIPCAVADTDTAIDLAVNPDTGRLMSKYLTRSRATLHRRVACHTVDYLIEDLETPAPDFIRINAAGNEQLILFGSRKTLSMIRPDILLQYHSKYLYQDCANLLTGFGYRIDLVGEPAHGWLRATQ